MILRVIVFFFSLEKLDDEYWKFRCPSMTGHCEILVPKGKWMCKEYMISVHVTLKPLLVRCLRTFVVKELKIYLSCSGRVTIDYGGAMGPVPHLNQFWLALMCLQRMINIYIYLISHLHITSRWFEMANKFNYTRPLLFWCLFVDREKLVWASMEVSRQWILIRERDLRERII